MWSILERFKTFILIKVWVKETTEEKYLQGNLHNCRLRIPLKQVMGMKVIMSWNQEQIRIGQFERSTPVSIVQSRVFSP